MRLTQEFGVVGNRVSTYNDSYHGLASQGGSVVVGQLLQLPRRAQHSAVERSALHHQSRQPRRDLRAVPQGRYPASSPCTKVHVDTDGGAGTDSGTRAVRYIRWFYIPLILLVIGGMLLHNAILWRAKTRRPPPRCRRTPSSA